MTDTDPTSELADLAARVLADVHPDLATALGDNPTDTMTPVVNAVLDQAAAQQWIAKQLAETGIRSMDFRNGMHMDIDAARDLLAHQVAAARSMLGDAPNYTETKVEFDVKVAESPEMYTIVIQRHAPGALTPHEARQKAEARVAELETELAALKSLARRAGYEAELPQGPHPDAFPWLKHLDPWDRAQLLADLAEAATGLHTPDAINELNRTVHEWKTTAEALANPELRAALTDKDVPGGTQ